MGKKGKRSGFGGSGGGGNARGGGGGGPRGASGLVVVNPMLLQSMGSKSSGPAKDLGRAKGKMQPQAKHKTQAQSEPTSRKRKQRNATDSEDHDEAEPTAKKAHQETGPTKQKHKKHVVATDDSMVAPLYQLQLTREDQCLAGLYWVLLTRETKRSAVIAIPNAHATLTPPLLANVCKSLGYQALSLHSKMTAGQRKQHVERFVTQSRAGNDKCVLVCNDHWLNLAACGTADLVAFGAAFVGKTTVDTKFARVFVVHADTTVPARAIAYDTPLSSSVLSLLQARLKLATQIATTLQRVQTTAASASDGAETKWATKFAKGADLSDDEEADATKHKKKKGGPLNPDEQRLRALTEKLLVLLARNLTEAASSSNASATSLKPASADAHHRAEKLAVLGINMLSAAMGANDGERLSAQTQWLDDAPAVRFGGHWHGVVRHGASKDATSLAVRQSLCASLTTPTTSKTTTHLRQWRPNQQPVDVDAWGGAYGKACGHNEVVLHHVRPFFPQLVLNSRVCSKRQPAPGNQGFDGCLEFLRLACREGQRCMTVWDAEQFLFFSPQGDVRGVPKLQFLTLPLAGLQTLMASMRQWTLACDGRQSPVLLLEGIRLCCRLGTEDVVRTRLTDVKLVRRVLAFAIGGSTRVWKQIGKMPMPIAREIVYDAL